MWLYWISMIIKLVYLLFSADTRGVRWSVKWKKLNTTCAGTAGIVSQLTARAQVLARTMRTGWSGTRCHPGGTATSGSGSCFMRRRHGCLLSRNRVTYLHNNCAVFASPNRGMCAPLFTCSVLKRYYHVSSNLMMRDPKPYNVYKNLF